MSVIKIKEHEKVFIGREGTKSISSFHAYQLDKINSSLSCNLFQWEKNSLKFKQYCGVVGIGKNIIEILPKIYGLEKNENESRNVLIKMLKVTSDLKLIQSGFSSIQLQNYSLLDVFIEFFLDELTKQIQEGFIKTYVSSEENTKFLKGKLLFKDQIKFNSVHRERFYCRYDEFLEDNVYNQILKTTLQYLKSKVTTNKTVRRIVEMLHIFNVVSDRTRTVEDIRRLPQNRMVERYCYVFKMAEFLLSGSSPDIVSGRFDTISLLFDMNRLFEQFIGKRVKKICRDYRVNFEPRGYLAKRENTSVFRLKPDIVIWDKETNKPELIIDTKWKVISSDDKKHGASQSDLYQMHAYATSYDCKRIVLLYPHQEMIKGDVVPVFNINNTDVKIEIRTIDVCKSLKFLDEELMKMIKS